MTVIAVLPMASLTKMSVDEQDKLVREAAAIETTMKGATDAHKQSFSMVGKIICIVEERLNELKAIRKIASNTSLASFWEVITQGNKGKGHGVKLNTHAMSCAVAYGTFVRSELISEADYDKNPSSNLELAASISTAVGGEIAHDAVHGAALELRERSKDTPKKLRAILETVKDKEPMTAEQVNKVLAKIFADGHLNLVIAGVGAEIAHVEDSEVARSAYFGMITANDMFGANVDAKGSRRFDDKLINAWANAYTAENPQSEAAQFAAAPTPTAPIPAPETPAKGKGKQKTEATPPAETTAPALAAAA